MFWLFLKEEDRNVYDTFSYYLPFGEIEPIEDTKWMVKKAFSDYLEETLKI